MKKHIFIAALFSFIFITGLVSADTTESEKPIRKENLAAIREVNPKDTSSLMRSPKTYEIPMTQVMQKADGSGMVEVVAPPVKVTRQQLEQGIKQLNSMISNQQSQLKRAQDQLDAINAKEAQAVAQSEVKSEVKP